MTYPIEDLVAQFNVAGEFHHALRFESGHINDTYRIDMLINGGERSYTLQRINHSVFMRPHALMENVQRVTTHLKRKLTACGTPDVDRRVLTIVPTIHDALCHQHSDGTYWRMYDFIAGAHTASNCPSNEDIYEAALGFGRFIALLADLPGPPLTETISKFHCGENRYDALVAAVESDPCNRALEVRGETERISDLHWLLAEPQSLFESRQVSLRTTHNDTKATNVLLDDVTNGVLCAIDLDTVMPGFALYDFGDLVRTTATAVAEDAHDLSSIMVQQDRLSAAANGFLSGTGGTLEKSEVSSLRRGPSYMALIMATRFLTDYLMGDAYFKINRPEQNLERCRAQLAVTESLLACQDELDRLLNIG